MPNTCPVSSLVKWCFVNNLVNACNLLRVSVLSTKVGDHQVRLKNGVIYCSLQGKTKHYLHIGRVDVHLDDVNLSLDNTFPHHRSLPPRIYQSCLTFQHCQLIPLGCWNNYSLLKCISSWEIILITARHFKGDIQMIAMENTGQNRRKVISTLEIRINGNNHITWFISLKRPRSSLNVACNAYL